MNNKMTKRWKEYNHIWKQKKKKTKDVVTLQKIFNLTVPSVTLGYI